MLYCGITPSMSMNIWSVRRKWVVEMEVASKKNDQEHLWI